MPKKYRLSHVEFVRIQKLHPQRYVGMFTSLVTYPVLDGMVGPKVSVVVTKKSVPKATERNFLTRRYNGVVRQLIKTLSPTRIYVFHIKKDARTAEFTELKEDIHQILERTSSRGTIQRL